MYKFTFILGLVLLTVIKSEGQQQDLKNYLTATKTGEFEESQSIIKNLSFPSCTQYIFTSYGDITGLNFDTDTKGVKGYKAIFNCKVQNKAGSTIEKRMMAILYFDKELKKWRVLDIREPIAVSDEFQKAKGNIEISGAQYSWRRVSYWALMCGKLREAKDAIETSESRAKAINDDKFANPYRDVLNKIQ
jgi:hypothetical protein